MRRDLEGPGVPGWTQIPLFLAWLGPGNTNMRQLGSTPPPYPLVLHPGHYPRAPALPARSSAPSSPTGLGTTDLAVYDRFRPVVGDPRGQ